MSLERASLPLDEVLDRIRGTLTIVYAKDLSIKAKCFANNEESLRKLKNALSDREWFRIAVSLVVNGQHRIGRKEFMEAFVITPGENREFILCKTILENYNPKLKLEG